MTTRRGLVWPALATLLSACGGAPKGEEKEAKKEFALPDLPRPIAEDVKFPSAGRKSITMVEKNLLGYSFLGGGNLAEYDTGKAKYRFFFIRCRTAGQAGIYLSDIKGLLVEPKFVASYGGYYSQMPEGPLFLFAKGIYLAGIAGLSEEQAVEMGKEFAARL